MLQVMSASSQDHSRQESCTKSHVEGRNTINKQPRQHRVLIHHQCESNGEMSHQPQHATTTHRRDHPSTHEHEQQEGRTSQESGVGVQVMKQTKLAKAPGAPKRFKSSYIFFSSWKHKQIREQLRISGNPSQMVNISKLVSEAWKNLSTKERARWEEMARVDRNRFETEKLSYKGPWKAVVPPRKSSSAQRLNAPKGPIPAYLSFSNERRAGVRESYPHATNSQISKILSTMWKEAPEDIRKAYRDEAAQRREQYKADVAAWSATLLDQQEREGVDDSGVTPKEATSSPQEYKDKPPKRALPSSAASRKSKKDRSKRVSGLLPGSDYSIAHADRKLEGSAVHSGLSVSSQDRLSIKGEIHSNHRNHRPESSTIFQSSQLAMSDSKFSVGKGLEWHPRTAVHKDDNTNKNPLSSSQPSDGRKDGEASPTSSLSSSTKERFLDDCLSESEDVMKYGSDPLEVMDSDDDELGL